MHGKNIVRKFVTLGTLATVWCVYSMVAFAIPAATTGEITVTGQVTVNGQPAISNSTIVSGATITTAQGSSAVVSLGKLGRVEIQESSNLSLTFSDNSIITMLDAGKTRIASNTGVATTATTKNATFIGDSAQADNYVIEVECSHSHIDTIAGSVMMREGSSDKNVAAGSTAVAGNLVQTGCKPCLRPNSAPGPAIAGGLWLLLAAAGAAGVAIYFGTRGDSGRNAGGSVVVVSPSR